VWSRPRVLDYNSCTTHLLNHDPKRGGSVELFAAQSDPNDRAHFTFRFEVREAAGDSLRSGVFDAWLRADDSLIFEARPFITAAAKP
jgi:hypothetical protein